MPEYMHTYVRYASDVVACDAKGPVFPKKLPSMSKTCTASLTP